MIFYIHTQLSEIENESVCKCSEIKIKNKNIEDFEHELDQSNQFKLEHLQVYNEMKNVRI